VPRRVRTGPLQFLASNNRIKMSRVSRLMAPLCLTLLAGCASAPPSTARPMPVATEAPTCDNAAECGRMWSTARETIQSLTRLRLRVVTDAYLETFPPNSSQPTGGSVAMSPLGNGRFQIQATIECYYADCERLKVSGVNAFNARVRLSGDRLR
jgi:hypothetical protein